MHLCRYGWLYVFALAALIGSGCTGGGASVGAHVLRLTPEERTQLEKKTGVTFRRGKYIFKEFGTGEASRMVFRAREFGKHGLVIFDVQMDLGSKVENIKIIRHEEVRGRPILKKNSRWLRQYYQPLADEPLMLGRNVHIMSGATFTSKAIYRGVLKARELLRLYRRKQDAARSAQPLVSSFQPR